MARPWVLVIGLAALVGGCDTFAPPSTPVAPTAASGIQGRVLLGPTCDKPTTAAPCLEPYAALLVIVDTDGQKVGEVRSAADGSFQLPLAPGDYLIQPAAGGDPFPRAEAQNVTVLDGDMTTVEIDYETRDQPDQQGN